MSPFPPALLAVLFGLVSASAHVTIMDPHTRVRMRPPLVSMAETAAPSATDDAAVRRYSVGRKLATTRATTEGEAVPASAVSQIFSSSDLNAARAEAAANEQLLIVKFFAPWCRSCKSIQAKFSKLARSTPQHSFAEVNWVASRSLCKKLGITLLPTVFIYKGDELAAQLQVSYGRWPRFLKEIERFEKELGGTYVPRDSCDDKYWRCEGANADFCDFTKLSYDGDAMDDARHVLAAGPSGLDAFDEFDEDELEDFYMGS